MLLLLTLAIHFVTGRHLLTREKLCDQASWNHVLPDENCILHHLCAKPLPSPYNSILLYENGKFAAEHITSIPYSNTEFYTYFSLYICKYSMQNTSDRTLFEKMTYLLNTTVKTGTSFSQPCTLPTAHHFAPNCVCDLQKFCSTPTLVSDMEIFIYNKSMTKSGKLSSKAFDMGFTNTKMYHEPASILCKLQNMDVHNNKNLNTSTNLELMRLTNVQIARVSQYSNETVHERNSGTPWSLFAVIIIIMLGFSLLQLYLVVRKLFAERKSDLMQITQNSKPSDSGQTTENEDNLYIGSTSTSNDECSNKVNENIESILNADTLEHENSKKEQVGELVDLRKESPEEKQLPQTCSLRACKSLEYSVDELEPFISIHEDKAQEA